MNYIEEIKRNGLYLKKINKKEQTKEMCLTALNQNIESYEFVAVKLLDEEILSFIISNGINQDKSNQKKLKKLYNAIIDLGRKHKKIEDIYYLNEEFFRKAVELDYRMLLIIPNEKHTYEMCLDSITQDPCALFYINTDHMDEKLCIEAVKQDGNSIQFIPSDKLNENICLKAIEENGEAIRYIDKQFQTEKICAMAIEHCYLSIKHINKDILKNLDLTKYCICMEKVNLDEIKDEKIKNLKMLSLDFRFDFGFMMIMDILLKYNVSTNFLIDNMIEFNKYKELSLSNNAIILIDDGTIEYKYKLLANHIIQN